MVSSKDKSLTPNNAGLKGTLTNERYGTISQNNALNNIFRINDKRNTKELPFNKKQIQTDAVTAITQATHLGLAEAQMLEYINLKFNQVPNHENTAEFMFTLKEYMTDAGKKDPKSARNAIKHRLDAIASTAYSYNGGDDKSPYNQNFGAHPLLGYDYKRGGKVYVTLTSFFHDLLVNHTMPMPYPKLLFMLDPVRDAVAIYILKAIFVNKRINKASPRGNRIKVKTLLNKIESLPTYDEVMASDRRVTDRIIDPVFKAVERLANSKDGVINRYSFIDKDGKMLNYDNLDYATFIDADLVIEEWNHYPEMDLERWNKTQKKIQHRRKKNKAKQEKDKHHA